MDDPLRRLNIGRLSRRAGRVWRRTCSSVYLSLSVSPCRDDWNSLQIEYDVPARCTRTIRLPSSVEAMTAAGDLSGWFLEPIGQVDALSPGVSRPRAMVSTSGVRARCQDTRSTLQRLLALAKTKGQSKSIFRFAPPQPDSVCWGVHTKFRRSSQLPSLFSSSGAASVCDPGAGFGFRPRNIPSGVRIEQR
jgi:hypothetical protein